MMADSATTTANESLPYIIDIASGVPQLENGLILLFTVI
jgi:hypothetical protein